MTALDTPITYLKGVGPARGEMFRRMGVLTAGDLLYHVPHRYEDASTITRIAALERGRWLIDNTRGALLPLAEEYLPRTLVERAEVPSFRDALRMVHRPASLAEALAGRSRLAFEELLFVQLLHHRAKALSRTPR